MAWRPDDLATGQGLSSPPEQPTPNLIESIEGLAREPARSGQESHIRLDVSRRSLPRHDRYRHELTRAVQRIAAREDTWHVAGWQHLSAGLNLPALRCCHHHILSAVQGNGLRLG